MRQDNYYIENLCQFMVPIPEISVTGLSTIRHSQRTEFAIILLEFVCVYRTQTSTVLSVFGWHDTCHQHLNDARYIL